MSSIPSTFIAPAALRLTFCPRCDYALEGLPDEGTCPECGAAYDQSCIVLRGKPLAGEAGDPAVQGNISTGNVLMTMLPLLFYFWLFGHRLTITNPSLIFWSGIALFPVAVGLIVRASSARPGLVLVWISPEGIAQGSMGERGPMTIWLQRVATVASALAFQMFIMTQGGPPHAFQFIPYLVVAVILIPIIVIKGYRGRRRARQLIPARGERPPLLPWSVVKSVTLKPRKKSGFQLFVTPYGLGQQIDARARDARHHAPAGDGRWRLHRQLETADSSSIPSHPAERTKSWVHRCLPNRVSSRL